MHCEEETFSKWSFFIFYLFFSSEITYPLLNESGGMVHILQKAPRYIVKSSQTSASQLYVDSLKIFKMLK